VYLGFIVPALFEPIINQPLISIAEIVGLYNSTNSSFVPLGPRVRNSLITTEFAGYIACGAARAGSPTAGKAKPLHRAVTKIRKKKLRQKSCVFFIRTVTIVPKV